MKSFIFFRIVKKIIYNFKNKISHTKKSEAENCYDCLCAFLLKIISTYLHFLKSQKDNIKKLSHSVFCHNFKHRTQTVVYFALCFGKRVAAFRPAYGKL